VAFALLILDRVHREETENHLDATKAAVADLDTTSRAVLVGGTAVVLALGLVAIIGPTQLMVSLGTGMLTCALFAIGGAVVVMPAALVLLGRRIDAFSFPAPAPLGGAWSRIVGGGNWVTRNAVFAGFFATVLLAALAVPAFALSSGPQTISQLPKGSKARTAFEEISRVMGPGWATPYNIIVVARNQPITTPSVLKSMQQLELQIARNRSVSSVTGPGAINVTAKQLASFGPQLNHSAAVSEQSKKDLLTLINGLGLAGSGSAQLQSGLAAAASGASQLHAGGGAAHTGAGQLHSGLSQAQAGSEQLKAGLDQALTGATALKSGASQALSGATQLASGLGKGSPQVTAGLPAVGQLASSSGAAASQITSLKGQAQNAQSAASQALSTLRGMTTGKNDPNYQAALSQLSAANGALNSVIGGLGSAASDANSAAFIAAGVKSQVETLAPQLTAAASGASQLQAGIAQLRDGNAQLATGLGQLSNGGGQLNSGLGQLTAGAGQLEDGLSQLTTGAAQLASGLSGGIGPAGQLTLGLGTMQAAVTKARGQIPSTAQLRQLQQQSPGLFSSGYFVLAAVHGAPPAQRTAASFTVNLLRGGTAGQIVVVSKYDANDPRTVALGDTLGIQVNAWTKKTGGVQAAIGGPAGSLGDITSVADSRIWLDVGVIAVAIALVLAIALRAVLLPAVATILSLLVTAATFGLLQVLFGGSDPVLGGPGHITPMTIIGIFAVAFGVTVAFATLMLMRTREALTAGANTSRAVRIALRETAAAATGAGLVMVASLIPFATTRLIDVREFGTGVAIAVLLDILILRPVLLPAAEAVLGRYGWWPTSTSGPERPVHDTAHRRRRPHLGQRKAKVVHQ
jgi:X-X-X-Leu-X-X-Gly heptad repeat protein